MIGKASSATLPLIVPQGYLNERRDVFCELLRKKLSSSVKFQVPDGGLAVWAQFDPNIRLQNVQSNAMRHGLIFDNGLQYESQRYINAMRLGFGSLNSDELKNAVNILSSVISKL